MKRFVFTTGIPVLAYAAITGTNTPPAQFNETSSYGSNVVTHTGAYTNGPLDTADVQDFGNKDLNRIQGNIAKAVGRAAPYVDILEGGTIPAGVSDVVRAIVQERAVLNQSLCAPVFINDIGIAGQVGVAAEVGSTEYTYQLQSLRGMGPLVNVKVMRNAFETSYTVSEQALKAQIIQLNNADIRNILLTLGGTKLLVNSTLTFDQMCDGDMQSIGTKFPLLASGLPDAPLTFSLLQALGRRLREDLLVEPFETQDSESLLKFIGGQDILDLLRDDLDVRTDHRYLAAGSYNVGETTLTRYRWEGPYRGWAFGVDPQPLRFNTVGVAVAGMPDLIEPEQRVLVSGRGVGSRPNPGWIRAKYEIGFALGANTFRRLAPAQYTGEGSFKFPPQLTMGELKWNVIIDNINNVWGDFARHYYQISRAVRPERPHAVCAIAFKRFNNTYGLISSSDFADWSSTGSL